MRRRELLTGIGVVGLSGCTTSRSSSAEYARVDEVGDLAIEWPKPRGDDGNRAFHAGRVMPSEPERVWHDSVPFTDRSSYHPPIGTAGRFSIFEGRRRAIRYPDGEALETDDGFFEYQSFTGDSLLTTGGDTVRRFMGTDTVSRSRLHNDLGPPVPTDHTVVVAERNGTGGIHGLSPEDLHREWTVDAETAAGYAVAESGLLAVSTHSATVFVLDDAGEPRWDRHLEGTDCTRSPVVGSAIIYTLTDDRIRSESVISAFDLESGAVIYETRLPANLSELCLSPAYVAATDDDGTLYLLDRTNGTEIERVDADDGGRPVNATDRPLFGPTADEELIYQTLPDGRLRAVDPDACAERWSIELEQPIISHPTLAAESIVVRTNTGVAVLS